MYAYILYILYIYTSISIYLYVYILYKFIYIYILYKLVSTNCVAYICYFMIPDCNYIYIYIFPIKLSNLHYTNEQRAYNIEIKNIKRDYYTCTEPYDSFQKS